MCLSSCGYVAVLYTLSQRSAACITMWNTQHTSKQLVFNHTALPKEWTLANPFPFLPLSYCLSLNTGWKPKQSSLVRVLGWEATDLSAYLFRGRETLWNSRVQLGWGMPTHVSWGRSGRTRYSTISAALVKGSLKSRIWENIYRLWCSGGFQHCPKAQRKLSYLPMQCC